MKIKISCNDKKNKRTLSGGKKNCKSLNFVLDLIAFTAGNKKPFASAFSQGGIVPLPRAV